MADFGGKQQNFPKCHGFDSHCIKTMGEILEISHLTIHKTPFLCMKQGQWLNFPKCYDFNSQQAKLKKEILEISHLAIHKT